MTTNLDPLSLVLIETASTSARVDNARRSPGKRLSGMVRTLLGLNNSVLTDSRNNSSSGKRETGAFQRVGFKFRSQLSSC